MAAAVAVAVVVPVVPVAKAARVAMPTPPQKPDMTVNWARAVAPVLQVIRVLLAA